MRKRNRKSFIRIITAVMAVVMLVAAFSVTAFAAGTVTYTDVAGHWAEETIVKAAANGLDMLTGDKFEPDVAITREEFCRMVNWGFGLETKVDSLSFLDVSRADKYYDDIRIGVYSDYIHGRSSKQFDPKSPINRQEAMQIFFNMLPLYGVSATGGVEKFTDYGDISPWALEAVGTITNAGYVKGYPDGSVKPLRNITKAEAITLITRIVADQTIVHDDFTAKEGDVYKDTIFTGTIYVPAGAKVTFDNCSILGKLVSGTTEAATRWELPHDTKVANVEYQEPVTPTPTPTPTPEPDDEDFNAWFE
jgi:hypothetical protein